MVAVAIGGAAVVGAGASAVAGSKAAKATKNAAETAAAASQRATDAQVEEARRQYDTTRTDYAPYREAGYGALSRLQDMYGITGQTATGAPSGGAAPGAPSTWAQGYDNGAYRTIAEKAPGNVDWAAYVANNPDAAAQWASQTEDLASFGGDVNNYGRFHYQNDGARRDLSSYQEQDKPKPTTVGSGSAINAGIPGPDYTGIGTAPDYTDLGDAPDYSSIGDAPNYSNFTETPGYQFRLKRGIDAVKANASARGLLGSTATMKNIDAYAEGLAAQEYDAFYNRTKQAYDDRYNRITAGYDSAYNRRTSAFDANYNRRTAAYDAYANRLAAMAGVGQAATAQTANAGTNASNTIINAYGANGSNQANAATARGNATAASYTNLGSAINTGATNLASLYLYNQNGGFATTPYNRSGMI